MGNRSEFAHISSVCAYELGLRICARSDLESVTRQIVCKSLNGINDYTQTTVQLRQTFFHFDS